MYLLLLIVVLAIWVIMMFNGLIVLRNRVDESASDIDVQLKRRHDLIPNLINTVRGYATHESQLFERVTEARNAAMSAGNSMSARAEAENTLSGTLKSLFAVAENYPALRANENFLALQEELSDTENKIMASRRFYNTNVRDYNIRRETFPTNLLAEYFKFSKRDLFEIDDLAEKEVPKVDFSSPVSAATPVSTPEPAVEVEPPTVTPEEVVAEPAEQVDPTSESLPESEDNTIETPHQTADEENKQN